MSENRQMLERDDLVCYLTHSQHRWEKHGDDDVLAIDIQCKVNDQEDWVPILCDLLGWNAKQVEAFAQLTTAAYGSREYPWEGGFERHRVEFLSVIGGEDRVRHAVIWEGKINKFKSVFKDAEMSFRVQGTIESEEVAAQFIELERNLISLRIHPLQSDMFGHKQEGDDEGVTREEAEAEEPES